MWDLEKIQNFSKIFFFRFPAPQWRGTTPPTRIFGEFTWKGLVLWSKLPFRATFYLNLTLTSVVLNLILVCVEHVKSWWFQLFSRVQAIEIQAVVIKMWFIAIWWCFWCILILLNKKLFFIYLVYWFKWTRNSWVHFISPLVGEMRMYPLNDTHNGPILFLCDIF